MSPNNNSTESKSKSNSTSKLSDPSATANSKKILVTGGAGYIGSHTVVQLLQDGYQVVVLDNLYNSTKVVDETGKPESLIRAEQLAGRQCEFVLGDLLDRDCLTRLFTAHAFESVIHFAAYKSVGQSCATPLAYYRNNLTGSLNLLETMSTFGVKRLVFSSSSTVYGPPSYLPLDEGHPTGACTNPYGRSKFMMEQIIRDVCAANADAGWQAIMLRYFNPIGAHPSGRIGEDPSGVPRNLVPYICQVLVGRLECVSVFGTDYETPDGSAVRGYIHVMDVVRGHLAALKRLNEEAPGRKANWSVYNLGMGRGHSVLEIIAEFERVTGKKVPHRAVGRRTGDIPMSYADCSRAEHELGWRPEKNLTDMCRDSWRWQSINPNGYVRAVNDNIKSARMPIENE